MRLATPSACGPASSPASPVEKKNDDGYRNRFITRFSRLINKLVDHLKYVMKKLKFLRNLSFNPFQMLRSLGRLGDQQGRNARFSTGPESAVRLCSFWCAGYPVRRRAAAHHECAWPPTVRVARARRRAQCVRHSFAAASVCRSPSNSPPVTRGDGTYGPSSYVQLPYAKAAADGSPDAMHWFKVDRRIISTGTL